jgi:hypothetical protein
VSWVVEDGHVELKEGFVTADAGGPEWGAFDFTLEVEKQRPHSTLTLVLFESSAKDGSRVGELAVPLYWVLNKKLQDKTMANLPEEFTIDELIDHLLFTEKVEERIKQADAEEVIANEDVRLMLEKWSGKFGQHCL